MTGLLQSEEEYFSHYGVALLRELDPFTVSIMPRPKGEAVTCLDDFLGIPSRPRSMVFVAEAVRFDYGFFQGHGVWLAG